MNIVKDQFGTIIQPGDIIIYPTRQSSSLWMNVALVTEISEKQHNVYYEGKPYPILKVVRVGRRWGFESGDEFYKCKTTIENITNVTVITKDMVVNSENDEHKKFVEICL